MELAVVASFALSLVALLVYVSFFSNQRDVFWGSVHSSVLAGWLLVTGLMRALRQPQPYRGRLPDRFLQCPVCNRWASRFAQLHGHKSFPLAHNAPRWTKGATVYSRGFLRKSNVTRSVAVNPIAAASGVARAPKSAAGFLRGIGEAPVTSELRGIQRTLNSLEERNSRCRH